MSRLWILKARRRVVWRGGTRRDTLPVLEEVTNGFYAQDTPQREMMACRVHNLALAQFLRAQKEQMQQGSVTAIRGDEVVRVSYMMSEDEDIEVVGRLVREGRRNVIRFD